MPLQHQEPVAPTIPTAQGADVRDTIHCLQRGAAMYTCPEKFRTTSQTDEMGQNFSGGLYQHGQQVDQGHLVRQLDDWMSMVQSAITFINIGPTGTQVGTTAETLRLAYKNAVSALLQAAASQLCQTRPALHEQYAHRIHVWAWPAATRAVETLSESARDIITNAQDTSVPIDQRAIKTVQAIISTYYPSEVGLFREIAYDAGDPGLTTVSPARLTPTPTAQAKLVVGRYFVTHTTPEGFARRVLQVAHELEHVRQQRRGQGGSGNRNLREFLAFTREALAQERLGTGRVSHATRVSLIDAALGHYDQLSVNQRATYAYDRARLLAARRNHVQKSGKTHPPAPVSARLAP